MALFLETCIFHSSLGVRCPFPEARTAVRVACTVCGGVNEGWKWTGLHFHGSGRVSPGVEARLLTRWRTCYSIEPRYYKQADEAEGGFPKAVCVDPHSHCSLGRAQQV